MSAATSFLVLTVLVNYVTCEVEPSKTSKPGSVPRNVQAMPLSSSTMVIQWDPPKEPNGQVTGYKVYYTTQPTLPTQLWQTQILDNYPLTTISDLTPQMIYTIKVQAFTSRGPGLLSLPVQMKTRLGARCNKESLDYPGLDNGTGFLAHGKSFEPECLPGYEATENSDRKIYCNKGEWTGNFPPCTPEPPMPPRIEVSMSTFPPGDSFRTQEGKPRRLRCICRGTNPPVKLKWLIDDTDITTMASQSNTPDVNNTKTWQAVSALDYVFQKDDNGKLLRCVAFHATYEHLYKDAHLRLEVLYIPEIHLEGKPVRDIEEGESVSVKCVTDANPPSLVIWRKSGYSSIYSLSNNISFLEVKRSDSANYSCCATNEVGQSEASYVNIDVKYKPSILKLFPNPGAVVSMHSNTTLTCEAEGNPPPKYSWLQKMKGDPVIWRQMGNTSSLHIPNVTDQYQGQYVCEVTNEINGYLYKAISTETSLHVIAEKQQEELPKQTSENVTTINHPCSCKYLVQDEELEAYDGNRLLKFRDEVHSGSLVMFACKEPEFYQLTGNASIRCPNDCSWRSNMFPSCSNPNKNDITIRIYAGTQEDMKFNVVPDGITTAICGRSLELQCSISDDHGSTLDEKTPAHVPTCSVSSLRDVIPQGVKPYLDASITGDLPHGYLVVLGCDDVGKTGMVSKGGDSAICGTDGRWEVSVDSDCV